MIYDKIQNLPAYRSLLPGIAIAEKFLATTDLSQLAPGKIALEDGVIVNVNRYSPAETGKWEAHRRYADLQYLVAGDEDMAVVPISDAADAGAYDDAADLQFFGGASRTVKLPFTADDFAIFLPQDIHMPGLRNALSGESVFKLVFKLPVPEAQC